MKRIARAKAKRYAALAKKKAGRSGTSFHASARSNIRNEGAQTRHNAPGRF